MFVMVVIVCVSLGDDTLDSRITRNGPDLLPMSPVVFAQAIGSHPKETALFVLAMLRLICIVASVSRLRTVVSPRFFVWF
jgi:hypothetical protein